MPKCKECGAEILFIQTPKRTWMPVDDGLVPYRKDNIGHDVLVNDKGEVIRCRTEFRGEPDGYAHRPHWATCTKPDKFRRKT